jgi:hypothetical protein
MRTSTTSIPCAEKTGPSSAVVEVEVLLEATGYSTWSAERITVGFNEMGDLPK